MDYDVSNIEEYDLKPFVGNDDWKLEMENKTEQFDVAPPRIMRPIDNTIDYHQEEIIQRTIGCSQRHEEPSIIKSVLTTAAIYHFIRKLFI